MFQTARILDSYRKRSQDRAEIIQHKLGVVIALADGAGGMSGGDEAADTAIMWVRSFVERAESLLASAQWIELLSKLDVQINASEGGQTTAVIVAITGDGICGASVGDSAAWIVRPCECLDLTGKQVQKPMLGSRLAKPVSFEAGPLEGTLLVASDGLVKYAPRERICAAALEKSLPVAGRRMVDLARLRSGQLQDDVSLVLCRRGQ